MASDRPDRYGYGGWSATGVGTNAGVTVTHTITSGSSQCTVTAIQCSSDAAALVTIESPANTVLWRKRFTGAFSMSEGFAPMLKGATSSNILVKISASSANCEANMQGFDV